jgi:hypothetical protein
MALQDRDITKAGYKLIIRSGSVGQKVQDAIVKGLKVSAEEYLKRVKKVISLDDHTLEELRRLGYPYARRGDVKKVHPDDRDVHIQTGKLRKSIRLGPVSQETTRKSAVYIMSDASYMPYLLHGTDKMRPRRFHEKAYEEIRGSAWNPLVNLLKGIRHRITTFVR